MALFWMVAGLTVGPLVPLPEASADAHEELTRHAETILERLELPTNLLTAVVAPATAAGRLLPEVAGAELEPGQFDQGDHAAAVVEHRDVGRFEVGNHAGHGRPQRLHQPG